MSLTDDETESGDFGNVAEKDFQLIKNKISKLNYADGVTNGRDSVFQLSFDQGYKDGLHTSFEIEKYRQFFVNLNLDANEESHILRHEKEEFDKLHLPESKSTDHFQYVNHKNENHKFISKKQHDYVDSIVERLSQDLPQVSNLLKPKISINRISTSINFS